MRIKHISTLTLTTTILLTTACSRSSDPAEPDSSGQLLNFVGIIGANNEENLTMMTGSLLQLDSPVTAASVKQEVLPEADICTVTRYGDSLESNDGPLLLAGSTTEFASGGEVITVTSPAGSYAELQKIDGDVNYISETDLTAPAPDSLTINIPGDVFPAFSNAAIPDSQPLIMTTGNGSRVTPSTTFSWTAGSAQSGSVRIEAEYYEGAETNQTVELSCQVVDDGSFSLPTDIQQQMGNEFSSESYTAVRNTYNIYQAGNAVLYTNFADSKN